MSSNPGFWPQLTRELLSGSYQHPDNNFDASRFSPPSLRERIKDRLLAAAASVGFYREPWNYALVLDRMARAGDFDRTMELLADDASRELLVKLMAFRVLGHRHYRLPTNTPEYWRLRESGARYVKKEGVVRASVHGALDEFEYEGTRMVAHQLSLFVTFLLEQYRCRRAGIGVRPGDVVVDGGACWGDTSLYFARQASRVFAYECDPPNIELLRRNLEMNPTLAAKITLVQKALWDVSGDTLRFDSRGAASRAGADVGDLSVQTHTIDDLVREQRLDRVDFIKMDIEGAETRALMGARETIQRFRPRLAICVYHSLDDFVRIPEIIAGFDSRYRLYLDHFTIHSEESVVFATCEEQR